MLWWRRMQIFFFPASSPFFCLWTINLNCMSVLGKACAPSVPVLHGREELSYAPSFLCNCVSLKQGVSSSRGAKQNPFAKGVVKALIVVRHEGILCKYYANKSISSACGTDEGCDLWRSNLEETHERNPFGIFHQQCFDLPYGNQYFWK